MERGQTKYTEVGGIPELRAAVVREAPRATTGSSTRPTRSSCRCGAKHTLYNIVHGAARTRATRCSSRARTGCRYPEQVRLLGGVPGHRADPRVARASTSTPRRSRGAVTPRTKLIVLDSPANPTGAVFSAEALRAVGAGRGRARALGRLRRVLRGAHLRGAARLDRVALARDQGAHDRGQHVLEGLRDDGLAHRLRGGPARHHPRA